MFKTIETLLTIALWAVAIFEFVAGGIMCISNLITGDGWTKFVSIAAIIIGIVVFYYVYAWLESIVWCMLFTGLVFCFVRVPEPGESEQTSQKEKKYGVGDAIIDAYVEEKVIEEAVTNAIRKSKE